jgi:nucleotide-binding universal stress UspA family protein
MILGYAAARGEQAQDARPTAQQQPVGDVLMRRFKNMLYVHDQDGDSRSALARAVRLARSNDAQLTLLSTSEAVPRAPDGFAEALVGKRDDQLQSLLAGLDGTGLRTRSLHLTGKPFLEIIRQVIRGGHDLLIKPAGGTGNFSSALFGSTDWHLLRKCPCPVWIVKASNKKKYARIVAAIDPDPAEVANAELNGMILDLATSLARAEGSELHVVHAWKLTYENALRHGRSGMPKREIDRLVRGTRKTHKRWMEALLARHDLQGVYARLHLVKGDPGDVIPQLARKKRAQLVIMGTVARTGIPGLLIGNTAEKILAAVDCSVLALKPAAFVTPVEP